MYALGIGGLYGLMVKGFEVTHHTVEALYRSFPLASMRAWICRWPCSRWATLSASNCILYLLWRRPGLWPSRAHVRLDLRLACGWFLVDGFYTIWSTQVRYVGVGAMVVGGIYTLWTMRKTIITGLSKAFIKNDDQNQVLLRTEQDIPMNRVFTVCGVLVFATFFFYWWAMESPILAFAGALFLAFVAFFFAAVAGYIAGVVGSSNSPVSGMTIATLLFTVGLVYVIGDLMLGRATDLMFATLLIAAIVASSAAIAGDVMQDLKPATCWEQHQNDSRWRKSLVY